MERYKVLTHVLPFGLAFMLAVAIAPEVRAAPPSINAIATNTQPLSDSDRRAVERYTTFWTDVLKRAAEAPEDVKNARDRLLSPLDGIGVSRSFRDHYTRVILPEVEQIVAEGNSHGISNALTVLAMTGTDQALKQLVDWSDPTEEDRAFVRISAARSTRQLLREVAPDAIRPTVLTAQVRNLRDAAQKEPNPVALRHQLTAIIAADRPDTREKVFAAVAVALSSTAERAAVAKPDEARALLAAMQPVLIDLRSAFFQIEDIQGQKTLGTNLAPSIRKALEVANVHWAEAQAQAKPFYRDYIYFCETSLTFIDEIVRRGEDRPETNLVVAWDENDRDRYAADLQAWEQIVEAYEGWR